MPSSGYYSVDESGMGRDFNKKNGIFRGTVVSHWSINHRIST